MDQLDNEKSSFMLKLDEITQQHKTRLETELAELRENFLHQTKPALPEEVARRLVGFDDHLNLRLSSQPAQPIQALLDIGRTAAIHDLDHIFSQEFALGSYFPTYRLDYPTVYCETLDEFFIPMLEQFDLSAQVKQVELRQLVAQAEEYACQKAGGGILGYDLPGKGCYLNGWLLAYGKDITPKQAIEHPETNRRIMKTAIHEKLGHGFLRAYSQLGEVKTRLGVNLIEVASRFGLHTSEDPIASLDRERAGLLSIVSQLLEEGWATWVETYLDVKIHADGSHPRHRLLQVLASVENLPPDLPERMEIHAALMGALLALFGEDESSFPDLNQAVMVIQVLSGQLDDYLSPALGQPLRYAVGELLFTQAENNLGSGCVPYAALIAANVQLNPPGLSLGDLRELVAKDPRLNPDARLAALSRLRLTRASSVNELAQRAEAVLSFSVPAELKG
jgi:hypothetical protein